MDIMQPRKIDGKGTYFNSCHLTSEILNNRQATFDVNNHSPAWGATGSLLFTSSVTTLRQLDEGMEQ